MHQRSRRGWLSTAIWSDPGTSNPSLDHIKSPKSCNESLGLHSKAGVSSLEIPGLVNVYITNWKDPPCNSSVNHGKSTINGPCSIAFCMFTRGYRVSQPTNDLPGYPMTSMLAQKFGLPWPGDDFSGGDLQGEAKCMARYGELGRWTLGFIWIHGVKHYILLITKKITKNKSRKTNHENNHQIHGISGEPYGISSHQSIPEPTPGYPVSICVSAISWAAYRLWERGPYHRLHRDPPCTHDETDLGIGK